MWFKSKLKVRLKSISNDVVKIFYGVIILLLCWRFIIESSCSSCTDFCVKSNLDASSKMYFYVLQGVKKQRDIKYFQQFNNVITRGWKYCYLFKSWSQNYCFPCGPSLKTSLTEFIFANSFTKKKQFHGDRKDFIKHYTILHWSFCLKNYQCLGNSMLIPIG